MAENLIDLEEFGEIQWRKNSLRGTSIENSWYQVLPIGWRGERESSIRIERSVGGCQGELQGGGS